MRIFYGVQGTGNGHISRARAMATHLQNAANIDTRYLFSGRPRDQYFDMEIFGNWQNKTGLSFVTERGRVNPAKTIIRNKLWRFYRDICELDLSQYDLVLSDFEPITAWAARRQGIPCITLGHQYAFRYDIPLEGDSWLSRSIIKYFAPGSEYLGLHWHHFGQPILPPIIDLRERSLPVKDNQVLVYLGFEDPAEVILLLHKFPQQKFVYYGEFSERRVEQNITLCPLSVKGFKHELAQSRGVICNAGFELASEALHLGKRLLVKPLHGQMEQLSNALALTSLKLGQRMENLSEAAIRDWLDCAEQPDCQYPDVAAAIVNWLQQSQRCPVAELAGRLWAEARVASAGPAGDNDVRVPVAAAG